MAVLPIEIDHKRRFQHNDGTSLYSFEGQHYIPVKLPKLHTGGRNTLLERPYFRTEEKVGGPAAFLSLTLAKTLIHANAASWKSTMSYETRQQICKADRPSFYPCGCQ
jgi:hypothetical protein